MNTQINFAVFNDFPRLESERLIFRKYQLSDAVDLFEIRSNKKVMAYMDSTYHTSVNDSEKHILANLEAFEQKKGLVWVIIEKSSGKMIGDFGFWRLIPSQCRGEIGYVLKPKYWGLGYMQETMKTLLNFGFTELSLHSVEANINPENQSSKKLLLKIGFVKEAYFRENYLYEGRFLDSEIYSLLEGD